MWRFIRSAPLTFSWLAILLATSVYQHVLTRRELHAVLEHQSTNLHHLATDPIRVLFASLLWIDGVWWWPYLLMYCLILVPAERWLGSLRWLAVGLLAHVVATYVGEGTLYWAIQEAEAVQEQTAAALQELADMQEKKTELKGEIKSLSGTVAALKAAERVRVDFDTIQPEKTLTGAVKGVTVEQIQQLKKVAMTGAAAKQAVVELKKKNAALEKENAEMQKKIPSTMDRLLEKKNLELLETRNFNLRQENKELKEALEEERSFSDRLLEGIDRVLDMLERHLPKQLLHLVDKARDLLPEHQTYRQEKQHERGHSWGDMSL